MGLVNEKDDLNHSDTPSSSDEVIADNISYTPAEERALLRKGTVVTCFVFCFVLFCWSCINKLNVKDLSS
jgi:hypothetical protein